MVNEKFNELDNEELCAVDGGSIGMACFVGACVIAGAIGIVNGYCDAKNK
nr:Blp family class II bacteriocin [uncultured Cellulosilyticum sp.]